MLKSKIRTLVKEVEKTPEPSALKKAVALLDKAARQRVIHSNVASRTKSRLTRLVNQKPVEVKAT
jgi:ribosomal protein S20